jgi:uncharacterized RDD family membrane protein YckC
MTGTSSEPRQDARQEPGQEQREVPIATLGARTFGAIVDMLIVVTIWSAFGLAFGQAPDTGFGFKLEGAPALLSFGGIFAYFIVTEAVWSATPGKMLIGMRVVNEEDGAAIGWQRAIVRNLLRVVDFFPSLYLVGFIAAVSSPKSQRLGDRMARTVVVRD